jgi:hypothetical protein
MKIIVLQDVMCSLVDVLSSTLKMEITRLHDAISQTTLIFKMRQCEFLILHYKFNKYDMLVFAALGTS